MKMDHHCPWVFGSWMWQDVVAICVVNMMRNLWVLGHQIFSPSPSRMQRGWHFASACFWGTIVLGRETRCLLAILQRVWFLTLNIFECHTKTWDLTHGRWVMQELLASSFWSSTQEHAHHSYYLGFAWFCLVQLLGPDLKPRGNTFCCFCSTRLCNALEQLWALLPTLPDTQQCRLRLWMTGNPKESNEIPHGWSIYESFCVSICIYNYLYCIYIYNLSNSLEIFIFFIISNSVNLRGRLRSSHATQTTKACGIPWQAGHWRPTLSIPFPSFAAWYMWLLHDCYSIVNGCNMLYNILISLNVCDILTTPFREAHFCRTQLLRPHGAKSWRSTRNRRRKFAGRSVMVSPWPWPWPWPGPKRSWFVLLCPALRTWITCFPMLLKIENVTCVMQSMQSNGLSRASGQGADLFSRNHLRALHLHHVLRSGWRSQRSWRGRCSDFSVCNLVTWEPTPWPGIKYRQ